MSNCWKFLPRRTFLRGLGATVALPLLDAMSPALAARRSRQSRLAFLYVPNGIDMANWNVEQGRCPSGARAAAHPRPLDGVPG